MILDRLDNAERYFGTHHRLAAAFAVLRRTDLAEMPEGRFEVDGVDIYAVVIKGRGRKPEEALIETHDDYMDIQFVLAGVDTMGWKPRAELGTPTDASDPHADVAFYKDAPTVWTDVGPGMFAIYFPEDAHMPLISDGDLHKVVVKVRI